MSPTASPAVAADASIDVEAVAGATSGVLMLMMLAVVVVVLVAKRRQYLKTDRKIVEWEQQHRPLALTNPVYAAAGTPFVAPFEHAGSRDEPGQTVAVAAHGTYEIANRSGGTYLVPAEPSLLGESNTDTDMACRTADLIYAVPVDEVGSDVSGSVYVSAKPHGSGGYQPLDDNSACGTREAPVYGIPSETGSLVLYATADEGPISPDSDVHGEYPVVDGKGRADDACATPREGVEASGLAAGQGVSPVYVSPKLPDDAGYQTLDDNGAYATRLPTGSKFPYDTLAESSVYAIPSETGSLVLIAPCEEGVISRDSDPHGKYLEMDAKERSDDACATA